MPRRTGRHAARLAIRLALLFLFALPAPSGAEERIATIMVYGLRHIDRDRLLNDLSVDEGGAYAEDLEAKLRYRAKRLAYLKHFHVESSRGDQGVHMTFQVREASRLRLAPFFEVQEDGDIGGGFLGESDALLGKNELWRLRVIGGGRTEASLELRDLRGGADWLPGLNVSAGIEDWDNPFWKSEARKHWLLAGPSFFLPNSGRLALLAGYEGLDSTPPAGISPIGEDEYALVKAELRQPLGAGLGLEFDGEYRAKQESHGFGRGVLRLRADRAQGRWDFGGLAATGMAAERGPASAMYYMDSWNYLRAYDPGSLPARRFHFLRLRADLRLTRMGIRMSRNGPEEQMVYGIYVLLEGALSKPLPDDSYFSSSDYGLGLSIRLPSRFPTRASIGVQWDDEGNEVGIFLLEAN